MEEVPSNTPESRPVFYAGRFAELVKARLPQGCEVLSDWDVLPANLTAVTERASTLVVLDPLSFPFEVLTGVQREVPLILLLPSGFDAEFLTGVFGKVILDRLGFFDRVATPDPAVWESLRARYHWAGSQRIALDSARPGEAVGTIHALLERERETPVFSGDGHYEAVRYWSERGEALAGSVPHRAVCSVRHGPEFNKAMHRAQGAAIEPQFVAARGSRAEDILFDVLEVGAGVGRWAASFDPSTTRFSGVDISEGMVAAARANFPEARFDRIGADLTLPYEDESFDLAFTVTVMHHNPTPAKRKLVSEMWRVVRPGGRLLFLEDFVAGGWTERSTVYPMPVTEFVELLLEATDGQVTLEHVESVKYPHDDLTRGGVLALSRLGVPKRW
jgi:SAM-dependent methyltransferase